MCFRPLLAVSQVGEASFAILDVHNALTAAGGQGLPAATVSKAKANLIRAGVLPAKE